MRLIPVRGLKLSSVFKFVQTIWTLSYFGIQSVDKIINHWMCHLIFYRAVTRKFNLPWESPVQLMNLKFEIRPLIFVLIMGKVSMVFLDHDLTCFVWNYLKLISFSVCNFGCPLSWSVVFKRIFKSTERVLLETAIIPSIRFLQQISVALTVLDSWCHL